MARPLHPALQSAWRAPAAALAALAGAPACAGDDGPVDPIVDPLCDEAVVAASLDPSGEAQPPFDLVFKVHIEPTSVEDHPPIDDRVDVYQQRFANVEAVLEAAASHHARASIHANGEFFEFAGERGDAERVRRWLDAGHHLGIHSHGIQWMDEHYWEEVPEHQLDEEASSDLWSTHDRFARGLLPDHAFTAATPHGSSYGFADGLMARFSYQVMGGGPNNVADDELGHEVWNPFRYATGTTLGEDLDAYALLVPHRGQIGLASPHGPEETFRDNTLPHLKVLALQAWLERQAAVRHGDPQRRWVFGFLDHDNADASGLPGHVEDVDSMFGFLDQVFRAPPAEGGLPGGCYATFDDVHARYVAWEDAHPGRSSFRYEEGVYPYRLAGLAEALRVTRDVAADHEAVVGHPDVAGTYAHRLRLGPRADVADALPVWLLWREDGRQGAFDLAAEMVSQGYAGSELVTVVDGETGEAREAHPVYVPVGPVPVLVLAPQRS